jgi:uncharacterized cupin superfamily protein
LGARSGARGWSAAAGRGDGAADRAGAIVPEASLEDVGSGLAPTSDGWFVVNVADAAWLGNDLFGARCVFEADQRVLRERPDLDPQRFAQVGYTISVIQPGQPSGLYHAESNQEDFLILAGECVALIDGEERPLRQWDFVHCPAGTAHCFVGAGTGPCVIFMTGARTTEKEIRYPEWDVAQRRGAGVRRETNSPAEAYEPFPSWFSKRPDLTGLPWASD